MSNPWRPLLSSLPPDLLLAVWCEPFDPNEPYGRVVEVVQRIVLYGCSRCQITWKCWDGEPTPCPRCNSEG
jgi:hypothetical protein